MPRFDPFDGKPLNALTAGDFTQLVDRQVLEGQWVEYKSTWTTSKVARAAASFANSEGGGTIIVGVPAEGLRPIHPLGFEFPAEIETAAVNCIRSQLDPIPDFEVGAAEMGQGKICLAIRVHAGANPPYVLKESGLILTRTLSSSEPVRLTDRQSLDRMFSRGQRGEEWGIRTCSERISYRRADADWPRGVWFWSIPCVERGLRGAEKIFRPSFIEAVEGLKLTPFGRPSYPPEVQTLPSALWIRESRIYEVTLTIDKQGVIETLMRKGMNPTTGDRDTLSVEDVRGMIEPTSRAHRFILEELLGYRGRITFGMHGGLVAMTHARTILVERDPFPVQSLGDISFHEDVERSLRRHIGPWVTDPEGSGA